ncbi:MarR family winged helix-turn-helix transcriptional regulator [Microbacterium sp. 22303]|uniref:MarR family winged helix-turn-helix transcriptional regulator n=1 Tax=Microbacterium sp. 22303 TaxID=3453905 RepID=UPI003F83FAC7
MDVKPDPIDTAPPLVYDPARRHEAGSAAEQDIRARVQQLTMRQQRFERAIAKRLELDAVGLEALDHLISGGPTTPTELAHRVEVSTAAMTLVLNRLEDRGHVRRERHPSDGRKLIVTASDEAATAARQLVAPLIVAVEGVIAAMSDGERAVVSRFLDELVDAYDRSTPD